MLRNIFNRIAFGTAHLERRLGVPLHDGNAIERRMNNFSGLTGGKGFRQPRKTRGDGVTRSERGDKRREQAAKAWVKAREEGRL